MTPAPPTTKKPDPAALAAPANIGGGFCEGCGGEVTTVNGKYHCPRCGANGGG